jgi:uncharacterized protein (TIGR02246 family)
MRRLPAYGLLIAMACASICTAQNYRAQEDTLAVRRVIDRYVQARNEKDAKAVRQLFTADADQLVSTGEWRRGLDEIVRGTSASSQSETNRSSITVEGLRFLDSDVALADGHYQTTGLNGTIRNMWTALF